YAAQLISAILDYKTIVDSRSLPIDRARSNRKGQPLCMEQYYRLFTSYRVPGLNKDMLVTNSTKLMPEPEHIIVICKNQLSNAYYNSHVLYVFEDQAEHIRTKDCHEYLEGHYVSFYIGHKAQMAR
ncbi:hypothetical protein Ahia01_000573500, partial [Argonauta hians]